jgi:hypothetical protein
LSVCPLGGVIDPVHVPAVSFWAEASAGTQKTAIPPNMFTNRIEHSDKT